MQPVPPTIPAPSRQSEPDGLPHPADVTPTDAVQRFREFRRSIGRIPRLHRRTISARGLQFAVFSSEDPGNGSTPVVCVNGGLLFDHSLLWPALAPLARHRQIILYDQRGRGRSSIPPAPHTSRIEYDAGDLPALRRALGIPCWHVLGHSWGGGICMLSTTHEKDSIKSLTLIDPVGLTSDWLQTLTPSAAARLNGPARQRLLDADVKIQPGSPDAANPAALSEYAAALYPAWFADQTLATLFSPPQSTSLTGAAVSARIRHKGYDWRRTIGPLDLPTLVIHGEQDLFPAAMARETAGHLGTTAQLLIIPDAGHNPFWEQPSLVFESIESHLNAAERQPPT